MAQDIVLDHQFLVEIGLGHLEAEEQRAILEKLYRVLELRVGQVLATSLTKNERSTVERLMEQGDSEAAKSYMQRVVPDYTFVARTELELIANSIIASVRSGEVTLVRAAHE